jgi:hypothetical protein
VEEINRLYNIKWGHVDNTRLLGRFERDLAELEKKSKASKVTIMEGRIRNRDGSYDYVSGGKVFASRIYDED